MKSNRSPIFKNSPQLEESPFENVNEISLFSSQNSQQIIQYSIEAACVSILELY